MKVVITGGAGSIGSAVAERLIEQKHGVVIADNREHGIHYMHGRIGDKCKIEFCDIREHDRLLDIFEGADVVFHAAALKHVVHCERYPAEAYKTNFTGTQNVVSAALLCNVKKLLFMSTDKTVKPKCVMGRTKKAAEEHVLNMNGRMKCSVIRSGNVLGSMGCFFNAVPHLIEQGKTVPITSKRMVRYIIEMPDLVTFILRAIEEMRGGEIFVPRMDCVNVYTYLIKKYGKFKHKVIRPRKGEKLFEELFCKDEIQTKTDWGYIAHKK